MVKVWRLFAYTVIGASFLPLFCAKTIALSCMIEQELQVTIILAPIVALK